MEKVFDYAVIYHGKIYPANTPIPVSEAAKPAVTENPKTAKKPAKKAGAKNDKAAD